MIYTPESVESSRRSGQAGRGDLETMASDLASHLKEYARQNPGAAALWCFGIGFVLGWKLRIW